MRHFMEHYIRLCVNHSLWGQELNQYKHSAWRPANRNHECPLPTLNLPFSLVKPSRRHIKTKRIYAALEFKKDLIKNSLTWLLCKLPFLCFSITITHYLRSLIITLHEILLQTSIDFIRDSLVWRHQPLVDTRLNVWLIIQFFRRLSNLVRESKRHWAHVWSSK